MYRLELCTRVYDLFKRVDQPLHASFGSSSHKTQIKSGASSHGPAPHDMSADMSVSVSQITSVYTTFASDFLRRANLNVTYCNTHRHTEPWVSLVVASAPRVAQESRRPDVGRWILRNSRQFSRISTLARAFAGRHTTSLDCSRQLRWVDYGSTPYQCEVEIDFLLSSSITGQNNGLQWHARG